MSLNYLKNVFNSIQSMESVSVQLVRIKNRSEGTNYFTRQIEIKPENELFDYLTEISNKYSSEKYFDSIGSLDEYQGDILKDNLYKLYVSDSLIQENYEKLETAIADPDVESEVIKNEWNALLIKGAILLDNKQEEIRLISMKSPLSVLSNRYIGCGRDSFKKLKDPVLTLNRNLDAIIVNNIFYMLTMQAENLFNMERSYKLQCNTRVEELLQYDLFSDPDVFVEMAKKGQNPRRFISFNQSRADAIRNHETRVKYLPMFNISVDPNGMIDTKDIKSSERLIKFLCNKAMMDPVEDAPREVAGAKVWI